MAILQKDIKILWGRSGNRCSICKKELTQDKQSVKAAFTLGEQAHIIGEKEDAARGKSSLTEDERNSYHNLILLCPTHHTEIDANEEDWSVEKLHMIKSVHEMWVQETLAETADSKTIANQLICASIIDQAVEKCALREWNNWTSFALAPDPSWPADLPDSIFEFRQKVIAAIWPEGFDELKQSTIKFSILLHVAAQRFLECSEEKGTVLRPDKFYKNRGAWNPNYDSDLIKYEAWLSECKMLLREATKALNWFADVVRRDINPMFFATEGKFIVVTGPYMDLSFRTELLEFSEEEKKQSTEEVLQKIKDEHTVRDQQESA